MRFTSLLAALSGVALLSACAHDYEAGRAAYDRGDFAEALRELEPLAQAGDGKAQVLLGIMYQRSWGVPQSSDKAREFWRAAAASKNARGVYDLGMASSLGLAAERPDPVEAVKWWRKAAEMKYPPAFIRLAEAYRRGRGVPHDRKKSNEWYRKGLSVYLEAAPNGPRRFQTDLGHLYRMGEGVPKDPEEAFNWYYKAAEAGHAEAQYRLASMYLVGNGVKRDANKAKEWFAKATDWYRKVGEQGGAWSSYRLGLTYSQGRGVKRDAVEATRWWRKAAEAYLKQAENGNTSAQRMLGFLYRRMEMQDLPKALEWTRKAAERGEPEAQSALARMYASGQGVVRDPLQASIWYEKAADQGKLDAQKALARIYFHGTGVPTDITAAIRWYERAAEQGDSGSQRELAGLYASDEHVPKDQLKSYMWLALANAQGMHALQTRLAAAMLGKIAENMTPAQIDEAQNQALAWFEANRPGHYDHALRKWLPEARKGELRAQFELGRLHAYGKGVPVNYRRASDWFLKSAEQGHADAQNALGFMYAEGRGVGQDDAKALVWIRKAAAQENVPARNNLGVLYRAGRGVSRDDTVALDWFRKAAHEGLADAQVNLGLMHANGHGVPQSNQLAYMWYSLSASNGNSIAARNRDQVARQMTREEILEAQRLSREWLSIYGKPRAAEVVNLLQASVADEPFLLRALAVNGTATGFFVTQDGLLVSSDHAVKGCRKITTKTPGKESLPADIVARDETNDIVLLKSKSKPGTIAKFRSSASVRPGDEVVSFGFPLSDILSSDGNLTTGQVSSLAGVKNDIRHFQLTAPIQAGNSGGPILDRSGRVVGMAAGKLGAFAVAIVTGDIPQNVNFAIKGNIVETFLEANQIKFVKADTAANSLTSPQIGELAKKFTVKVECWK